MEPAAKRNDWVSVETRAGKSIQASGATITPFATALRIGPPNLPFGMIWNRPTSILIQSADGQEEVRQVQDITRQVLWGILGVTLVMGALIWIFNRKQSKQGVNHANQ